MMELSPEVIVVLALAAVGGFVLLRRSRREEAPAVVDHRVAPIPANPVAPRRGSGNPTLVDWLLERVLEQTGVNVAGEPLARQRIEEAAAKATEDLRERGSALVSLPFLVVDAQGPQHFSVQFKRNADSKFVVER